jgi:hypothetical protein
LTASVNAGSVKKRGEFLDALFETNGVLTGWDWSEALTVITEDAAAQA